ncbi:MAG: site-specific integrase [Steroidobacteraceae bacterium]
MFDPTLFRRSRETQRWFQGSDLEPCVDAYVKRLAERGYATPSICMYVESIAHFAYWMRGKCIRLTDVNERLVRRFIDRHLPVCRCARRCQRSRHTVQAALVQLLIMIRAAGHIPPAVSNEREHIVRELSEFMHFLVDVRGVAAATQRHRYLHVRAFLRDRFPTAPIQLSVLKPAHITDFTLNYAPHWTPASKKALGNSLRSYFRYRALQGDRTAHLVAAIPRIAQWRMASLPKSLSDEELARLLGAFDRGTATGRRDYAIARCFADLGLRTTEIARLRLEDVAWHEGTVRIRSKGRRVDLLPLPQVTGRAIVQYLHEGRPVTSDRGLFVRHRPPVGKPVTSCIVRNAVRFAARRCGLEQCAHGPHILRHTVAKRLLQHGSTLKQIADTLRHRCLDTTGIYAKVDISALTRVALPWPGSRA